MGQSILIASLDKLISTTEFEGKWKVNCCYSTYLSFNVSFVQQICVMSKVLLFNPLRYFTYLLFNCIFFADKDHNFKKYDLREIDYLNEVYDTDSIMHYGKTAFSKNGKPTILALDDPSKPLGQRNGFSQTDITQLNALYDCSGNVRESVDFLLGQIVLVHLIISSFILSFQGANDGWSSWTAFGPCDERCVHVRQRFCASTDLANCPGADPYYHTQRDVQKCPDSKCYGNKIIDILN